MNEPLCLASLLSSCYNATTQKDLYKNKVTERFLWVQSTSQRTDPTASLVHPCSTYQIQLLADGAEIAPLGQRTEGISNLSWERNLRWFHLRFMD